MFRLDRIAGQVDDLAPETLRLCAFFADILALAAG